MTESTLSESTAKLVNYTVASPEFTQRKNKTKTCSDYWFPSRPVSLLQKFQMRHLAPRESRSDDF